MALPWAAAPPAADPAPPATRLPRVGDRIEVKWRIDDESTGASTVRWWGAAVTDVSGDATGTVTAKLMYDAYGEFEAEAATVSFLDARTLVSPATEDEAMRWRFEGEVADDDDPSDDGGSGEDEEEEDAVTLAQLDRRVSAEVAALAADAGVASTDAIAAAAAVSMAGGSMAGAAAATAKFQEFMAGVKAGLLQQAERTAAASGRASADVVLDEAAVLRAVEEAKRRATQ